MKSGPELLEYVRNVRAHWEYKPLNLTQGFPVFFHPHGVPDYMMPGIISYVKDGLPNGDFLTHIFENDFVRATMHADDKNIHALPVYAAILFERIPCEAWGSKAKVKAWIQAHETVRREERDA